MSDVTPEELRDFHARVARRQGQYAALTKYLNRQFKDMPDFEADAYLLMEACLVAVAKCIILAVSRGANDETPRAELERRCAEGVRAAGSNLSDMIEMGLLQALGKPAGAVVQ